MSDKVKRLERLAKLLDEGKLTQDEYEQAKKELLAEGETTSTSRHSDDHPLIGSPAGWYNDPSGRASYQAYWNGEGWTGATRSRQAPRTADQRWRPGCLTVILAAVVIAIVVTNLSGNEGDGGSPATVRSAGADESAGVVESPQDRCREASPSLLREVGSLLTVSGGGTLRDGKTVRSEDFEKVWFLAAEIDGSGIEGRGDVGIWATNTLDGSNLVLSVDAVAHELSEWPYGPDAESEVTQFDDGAREAKRCQGSR